MVNVDIDKLPNGFKIYCCSCHKNFIIVKDEKDEHLNSMGQYVCPFCKKKCP